MKALHTESTLEEVKKALLMSFDELKKPLKLSLEDFEKSVPPKSSYGALKKPLKPSFEKLKKTMPVISLLKEPKKCQDFSAKELKKQQEIPLKDLPVKKPLSLRPLPIEFKKPLPSVSVQERKIPSKSSFGDYKKPFNLNPSDGDLTPVPSIQSAALLQPIGTPPQKYRDQVLRAAKRYK